MQWEGREESENVEDRRGMAPKAAAIGGGGLVIMLIAYFLGVDPQKLMQITGQNAPVEQQGEPGQVNPAEERDRKFTSIILKDTEIV